jgi:hypothetical protein
MMRKFQVLLVVFFVAFSLQAQKTKISLNLEKGKIYSQGMEANIIIEQDVQGQKFNIDMTTKGVMSYLVKEKNASDYDLEVRYKSMTMNMNLPQGNMEFSSEIDDVKDVMSTVLRELIDKPFEVKMSMEGKITEVKNIESLFDSVIDQFPEIPEEQKEQLKSQMKNAYGAKAFKGNIEMVSAIFPDKPVRIGEIWHVTTNLESGFAAVVDTDYKLLEINSDYYLIQGDSKIKTKDKDVYVQNNGMDVRYDLSGTLLSKIKVDKITGWIISADVDQKLDGNTYVKANAQIPDGMTIPMTIRNKMKITGSM